MDYTRLLAEIHDEVAPLLGQGRVADYIAPLARTPLDRFGMALCTVDGECHCVGTAGDGFTIQSIGKVLSLNLAMRLEGDAIWRRVGREPSGGAFNSLAQLDLERGIPRNPFINAGAMVVIDAILDHADEAAILDFARRAAGQHDLDYDLEVAAAERETGHRNRALAHYLKSFGNLHNDTERVLEAYFHLCALRMDCTQLARTFLYLANGGVNATGEAIATARQVKRINAVMLTCGVYDEAGDYAYRVGLPAKSGVSGGVVAVLPGRFAVAAWSPGLSGHGNSVVATMALELLTTKTAWSIF
ncbi:MAG TPA: glutaminase [Xanthomonadaceae bacterium]|jgi:glutaminase|nr:glutaminase [Xanthomonadaceae bacterium]